MSGANALNRSWPLVKAMGVLLAASAAIGPAMLRAADGSAPFDAALADRVARSRGVRVSMIHGPQGRSATGWRCVAAWHKVPGRAPGATIWLSAADEEAASHLERGLRAFAAARPNGGFSLGFADAHGTCPDSATGAPPD
jgi:hypothetical protein